LVGVVAAIGAGNIGGEAAIHALPTSRQRSIRTAVACAGRPGQGNSPANIYPQRGGCGARKAFRRRVWRRLVEDRR
jgi:hypothetical protein